MRESFRFHDGIQIDSKHFENYVADQNAATVPHVAMMIAPIKIMRSNLEAWPARAIFAEMGPITQRRNDEKDPRKAIIELNSGTTTETATERAAIAVLSRIVRIRLRMNPLFRWYGM